MPLLTSLFSLLYIFIALIFAPPGLSRDFHFLNEFGAISILSMVYIAIATIYSIFNLSAEFKKKSDQVIMWTIFSLSFSFLLFDELFQFHEIAGHLFDRYSPFDFPISTNDLIVIIYGIVALLFLPIILPHIRREATLLRMFFIAFIFYILHTYTDTAISPRTEISTIVEESFKIFSMQFIMLGNVLRYKAMGN